MSRTSSTRCTRWCCRGVGRGTQVVASEAKQSRRTGAVPTGKARPPRRFARSWRSGNQKKRAARGGSSLDVLAFIIPRHEASRPACSDELPCRGRPGLNIRSLWPGRTNLAAYQNGHPVVRQHRPTLSFGPAFYGVRFRVAYSHRTRRRATAWAYGEPLAGYPDSPDRPTANCKQRWFPVSQHIDYGRFPRSVSGSSSASVVADRLRGRLSGCVCSRSPN